MVSLCEQCQNNGWRYFQEIIDAIREAGGDRPSCIWCEATNRPEDLQFSGCQFFCGYPTENTSEKVPNLAGDGRGQKNRAHMRGHRRIKRWEGSNR